LDGRRGREYGGDAHHRGHYNGGKQQADYTRCELVDRHLAVSPKRGEKLPRDRVALAKATGPYRGAV